MQDFSGQVPKRTSKFNEHSMPLLNFEKYLCQNIGKCINQIMTFIQANIKQRTYFECGICRTILNSMKNRVVSEKVLSEQ